MNQLTIIQRSIRIFTLIERSTILSDNLSFELSSNKTDDEEIGCIRVIRTYVSLLAVAIIMVLIIAYGLHPIRMIVKAD